MPARTRASRRSTSAVGSAPSSPNDPPGATTPGAPTCLSQRPNGRPYRGRPLVFPGEPSRPAAARLVPRPPLAASHRSRGIARRRSRAKKPPSRQEKRWQDLRDVANLRHPASGPPGLDVGPWSLRGSKSLSVGAVRHVPRHGGDALIAWSPDRLLSRGELWLRLPHQPQQRPAAISHAPSVNRWLSNIRAFSLPL